MWKAEGLMTASKVIVTPCSWKVGPDGEGGRITEKPDLTTWTNLLMLHSGLPEIWDMDNRVGAGSGKKWILPQSLWRECGPADTLILAQ